MYKIYRSNNYFVIIDPKGTYFEEQCENVFVTKRKEGDQTYTISFLRQETLRGGTALSQSFPGINFSDIVDEFGAPYASVAAWEDFYTTNTGVGYLLASLSTTGLATESTLQAVLAAVDNMRDYEVRLVEDSDTPVVTWLEVRYWDAQDGTLGTPEYYLPGSNTPGTPVAPLTYVPTSTLLSQIVAELQQIEANTLNTTNELTAANVSLNNIDNELIDQGNSLDVIEGDTTAIKNAVETLDNTVGTDGVAHGVSQEGFRALGTDGTNDQQLRTDADGHLQIDMVGQTRTPSLSRNVNTTGSVTSGARSVSFFNAGSDDCTVLGAVVAAGESITFSAGGEEDTLDTIAWTANTSATSTLVIAEIR